MSLVTVQIVSDNQAQLAMTRSSLAAMSNRAKKPWHCMHAKLHREDAANSNIFHQVTLLVNVGLVGLWRTLWTILITQL